MMPASRLTRLCFAALVACLLVGACAQASPSRTAAKAGEATPLEPEQAVALFEQASETPIMARLQEMVGAQLRFAETGATDGELWREGPTGAPRQTFTEPSAWGAALDAYVADGVAALFRTYADATTLPLAPALMAQELSETGMAVFSPRPGAASKLDLQGFNLVHETMQALREDWRDVPWLELVATLLVDMAWTPAKYVNPGVMQGAIALTRLAESRLVAAAGQQPVQVPADFPPLSWHKRLGAVSGASAAAAGATLPDASPPSSTEVSAVLAVVKGLAELDRMTAERRFQSLLAAQ